MRTLARTRRLPAGIFAGSVELRRFERCGFWRGPGREIRHMKLYGRSPTFLDRGMRRGGLWWSHHGGQGFDELRPLGVFLVEVLESDRNHAAHDSRRLSEARSSSSAFVSADCAVARGGHSVRECHPTRIVRYDDDGSPLALPKPPPDPGAQARLTELRGELLIITLHRHGSATSCPDFDAREPKRCDCVPTHSRAPRYHLQDRSSKSSQEISEWRGITESSFGTN